MDTWKYYDITHRNHILCNPTRLEKIDELISLLEVTSDSHILDIASGKAEFLIRCVEQYNVSGVGVDLSPLHFEDGRKNVEKRIPKADIELLLMDGADYKPDPLKPFHCAVCLGASWIYGGYKGTLNYLKSAVKTGGLVVSGEPFWRQEPSIEYLDIIGEQKETFGTHYSNMKLGEDLGLTLVYTIVSNEDDWDRYEGLQWYSADRYICEHPEDPDNQDLKDRISKEKNAFFRWGRDTLGWAIYIFRKP